MARKIIENVNEDMLKDMMMSDIPPSMEGKRS